MQCEFLRGLKRFWTIQPLSTSKAIILEEIVIGKNCSNLQENVRRIWRYFKIFLA